MTEPVEAEIVAETALAVPEPVSPVAAGALFGTTNPAEIMTAATQVSGLLAEAVRSRKLAKNFGGDREHVQVEGWQLLGAMLGIYAETEWTRQVTVDGVWKEPGDGKSGVGGWEARVVVKRADGSVVTAAEAECRWSERNWKTRDSYAVRSMSQTRASGKAYRTALGFVMTLAGYAATPAEEMDSITPEPQPAEDDGTGPRCPACGSRVDDQRETASAGQPLFKCSNRRCVGGRAKKGGGNWEWASWDPDQFTDLLTADTMTTGTGVDQTLDSVEDVYRTVQKETGAIRDLAETFVFEAATALGFVWPDQAMGDDDRIRLIDRAIYLGTNIDPPPAPPSSSDAVAAFAAYTLPSLQGASIREQKRRLETLAHAAKAEGRDGFPAFEEHGTKAYWNDRTQAAWEWAKTQGG